MTTYIRISHILRIITLVIGLFTISVSILEYRIKNRIEEKIAQLESKGETEQSTPDKNSNQSYLPDYQATISTFQLHMEQVPEILEHVPILLFIRKWFQKNFSITELNFFKTLFQHIISPNAP